MVVPIKKKTKQQLEIELRNCRNSKYSAVFTSLGKELIRWSGVVLVAYWIFRSIEVLAAKHTEASIVIDFLGKIEISMVFSLSVGILGVLYGLRQRKLLKDTAERLQSRIQMLELKLDINRSSSSLTSRGDSRPEDVE